MMPNQYWSRVLLGLLITLLLLVLLAQGMRPALLQAVERAIYDQRLNLTLQPAPDPRIVIIDIDEPALALLGRWPWPRGQLAALLDVLFDDYGIALLGMDVLFSEPYARIELAEVEQLLREGAGLQGLAALAERSGDAALAQRLQRYPVVLSLMFDQQDARLQLGALGPPVQLVGDALPATAPLPAPRGYIANIPELTNAAAAVGFFDNPLVDSDGVYRRTPLLQHYQGDYYPALALAMWQALVLEREVRLEVEADIRGQQPVLTALHTGGLRIPVDPQGAMLIPYRGKAGSFTYVSVADVLQGQIDLQLLAGAVAILGTSAGGLMDLRTTPVGAVYPGVEIHANLLSAMLDQRFFYQPDFVAVLELLGLALCGLLLSLLLPRLSVLAGSALALLLAGSLVAFNLYALVQWSWVLPLASWLLLIAVLFTLLQTAGLFIEVRNRQYLASVFGQYVPPEIVRQLQGRRQQIQLAGESRNMTVLFSDIRSFTSISEHLSPAQLARLINLYLSRMTQAIHQQHGTVDKYIGDAVMAFWGAPLDDPQHARHGLQTALTMLQALPEINQTLQREGLPPVAIGIGLNSGEMSVGNMGSSFRVAYTVLGDAVNLGARLEGLTKYYGVALLISESVREQAPEYACRQVDLVRVKGKSQPVAIYQPLGLHSTLSEADAQWLHACEQALAAYRAQDWQAAQAAFGALQQQDPSDRVSELYLQRIQQLANSRLPDDWDGVFDHQSK